MLTKVMERVAGFYEDLACFGHIEKLLVSSIIKDVKKSNLKLGLLSVAIVVSVGFMIISDVAHAAIEQLDDSAFSASPAPYWQQTLGNGLDVAVEDLEIRVKNSGDTFYAGDLWGYLRSDYASDYPIGYGIPPVEHYSFANYGSSTPSGFDGTVILGAPQVSFPLNPNRYYKFSINGGDQSRAFQVYGSASDAYLNGKAYFSYSYNPCASPLLNPEEACEPGLNDGITDVFFRLGTAETLLGNESAVTTDVTRQGDAVLDGDLIAWLDNFGTGLPTDIYVYEISTGQTIRITDDNAIKDNLRLAGRKILWTTRTINNPNDYDKATFIYDLDTSITTEITEKIGMRKFISDFDGQRIVLQSPYESIPGIYLYDLATDQLTLIDSNDPDKQGDGVGNPKISGDKILYTWAGGWRNMWCAENGLRLYDIATGEKTLIFNNYACGSIADYAIDNDNIIAAVPTSYSYNPYIYRHKISTGETTLISPLFRPIAGIDISENMVVWSDGLDIFVYDLATGKTGRTGMAEKESLYPKISGNTIVWDDYRNIASSSVDIYMYQIQPNASENQPPTSSSNQPPIITLLGENPIYLLVGDTFTDPGATATDDIDGDLTMFIVLSNTIDTSVVGSYIVTYSVTDSDGLTGVATRTVEVTPADSGGGGGSLNQPPTLSYSQDLGYVDDGINPDDGNSNTNFTFKIVYTDADNDPPTRIQTVVFDGSSSTTPATEVSSDAMTLDSSANATLHDGNYTNGEQYTVSKYFPAGVYRYRWEWSDGKAPCGLSCYAISDGIADGREQRFKVIENQPPIASFTFQPSNPKVGDTITFDASGSYDPDGTIVLYGWDWDTDGVTDAYSNTPSIQYSGFPAGTTTTTLRVIDDKGGVDTNTVSISVEPNNQSTGTASVLNAFCSAFGSWLCGAEVYQNEKDIKTIDEWLRDKDGNNIADANLEPFYWLKGTKCAGAGTTIKQEVCLVSALDTQFKDNTRHDSGLTYKAYVLSVIAEQEMVENALKRLTPGVYPYKAFAKALLKWLPSTDVGNALYNNITSKGIEDLLRASAPIIGGSTADLFGFGSSVVSLGLNAKKINETFNDINDETYLMALGGYFRNRLFGADPHTAWVQTSCGNINGNNDQTWWEKWFLTTNITECGPEALLKPQMSQKMLGETEIKFDEWYKKYDIEHFLNAELLGNTFKQGLKNNTETLIKYAIKNAPRR